MNLNKKQILDILFRVFIVISTNTALSLATVWFLEPAALYAGGATGIAQLIFRTINRLGGNMPGNALGWFIFLVNIPIVITGFKFVSRKFAIYSVLAVIVQSLVVLIIPESPFTELAKDLTYVGQDNVITTSMNYGGVLTLAIFGGLLAGIASGIALRFGVSTGGMDVVAQALALRKGISIGNFTMALNILIAIVGGGILQGSWVVVLFTVIRMILNSLVVDKIHTSYTYTALNIFSKKSKEISDTIMTELSRGCTLYHVTGAHSHEEFEEIYCVVSTYELHRALNLVKRFDPNAFISMSPVKRINGNFIKKTIV